MTSLITTGCFSPTTMSTTNDNDRGRPYHTQCTGPALATVSQHRDEADITLFGSCFCPFVQRVWVAFEYMGISYKVCPESVYGAMAFS